VHVKENSLLLVGNLRGYWKKYSRIEVRERRGRRRKQLLSDLNETRGYWKSKKEALVRNIWLTRYGRSYEPDVRLRNT
jgi:hypothetical protein